MKRLLLALFIGFMLLVPTGCDDRVPVPALYIVVMGDGSFLLNQQRMDVATMGAELRRVADENRRSITGQVRAYVYVSAERGVDFYRTQDVVDRCQRMGFMNVVNADAGMK